MPTPDDHAKAYASGRWSYQNDGECPYVRTDDWDLASSWRRGYTDSHAAATTGDRTCSPTLTPA